jgi:DNA adenine methylase
MANHTPLRYPGGKGRFSDYIAELIELNGISGGHYIEPFAGGAGVALTLLFSEHVKHIHINDIDQNIYAFWHSVLNDAEQLCKLIHDTPVTVDVWLEQREIKRAPENSSLLKRGFATFFLNRTNRSGILNGGIIGGFEQTGNWKIDARYNKADLISRIEKIALFSDRISLTNKDTCAFIEENLPFIRERSLIYFDPPYYVKGGQLYQNHFKHEDHEKLAKYIKGIKNHRWVVSYDNAPEIKDLYKRFRQEEFSLSYSASSYSKGNEVMIFQDELTCPNEVFTKKKKA